MMHGGDGEWSEKDGDKQMRVMILETETDENGKRVMMDCKKRIECKKNCCSDPKPGYCFKRMKMAEAGTENVFVKIIEVDGVEKKCVVIIKSMSEDDETMLMREAPESVPNLEKSELGIQDLVFSPNPNDGHFNLSFELTESTPAKIAVYSMEGRKVFSKKIKQPEGIISEDIDISQSGSGTYFLQITQGDKAQTKKVVIQ